MNHLDLKLELKGYWHAGGGRGAGSVYDAVVYRSAEGLPLLAGRHLKGLLRDALWRAENWNWEGFQQGITSTLFGGRPEESGDTPPKPGLLRVGDATLPDDVAKWLCSKEGQALRPGLFRGIYSTAVEHDTGMAKDHTLRGIEVTVPLTLNARIEPIGSGEKLPGGWQRLIEKVLPLIEAVGAHRSRGLGRVIIRVDRGGNTK